MNTSIETNIRPPRGRAVVLTASVILNVFLIALIGGHLLRAQRAPGMLVSFSRAVASAEATLPAADAAAFETVLQRDRPRYQESLRQVGVARAALEDQLTAEPFDRNKVGQALVNWRSAWLHFTDDFGGTLLDALAQVSPEGRRELIARRRAIRGDASN